MNELLRILAVIREKVGNGETDGNIMDVNGNKVGGWYWTKNSETFCVLLDTENSAFKD